MTPEESCFCDLAPLHALDLLEAADRQRLAAELADSPELQAELTDLEATVAALSYSAPIVEMSANLKDRLFHSLQLETPENPSGIVRTSPAEAAAEAIAAPTFAKFAPADLDWQPHAIPGVSIALVHSDDIRREVSGFLRAAAGMRYPQHRHGSVEEILMLEGEITFTANSNGTIVETLYRSGDYLRSQPNSAHSAFTTHGCMFFFRTSMDDVFEEEIGQRSPV